MNLARHFKRLLSPWRLPRAEPVTAVRPPDPADCGTAWGLELTVPPRGLPRKSPPRTPR